MIQIDMEMPKSCKVCPFEKFGDCYGGKAKYIMDIEDCMEAGIRHPNCPLEIVHTEKKPMDESKLKPCPFCGTPNTNLYFVKVDAPHGFDTVGIFCNSCKQTVILEENEWEGEDSRTREKAIEAWNRRANDG